MANQFDTVRKGGIESILGPSYNYARHIRTPDELGMTDEGGFGKLADNVRGILGYIDVLVSGQCKIGSCASTTGRNPDGTQGSTYQGPLGNKFFLPTVAECKDKATQKMVTRSIYINNVPDGSIPLVSNLDSNVSFSSFKGLMPGMLSNIAQIRPTQILMAFVNGKDPLCQTVVLETVDTNNVSTLQSAYLINSDINIMPNRWFPSSHPKSNYDLREPFTGYADATGASAAGSDASAAGASAAGASAAGASAAGADATDYSKMPNDTGIQIYYSMLGLLGLYILLRLTLKKKK
jgi:hypothetical protein